MCVPKVRYPRGIFKIIALQFLVCILFMLPLSAVLPPLYTSIDQIKGMLSDPALSTKMDSGEFIESIVRNEEGFIITTNKSIVQVTVKAKKQAMPGPAVFEFTFNKIKSRN